MVKVLAGFLFALQFLSRFRFKEIPFDERSFGRAPVFFPLIGLILGFVLAVLFVLTKEIFPEFIVAAVLVVAMIIITGGLHLDGFMDSMDGLMSGRERERKLEIMRDSRVGAFGVIGLAGLMLLKYSLLLSLPSEAFVRVLLVVPVLSRFSMVWAIARFPCARKNGLGLLMVSQTGTRELSIAGAISLILAVSICGFWGIALFFFSVVLTQWIGGLITRQLGGLTGDTYGAINEMMEVALLFLFYPVYKYTLGLEMFFRWMMSVFTEAI